VPILADPSPDPFSRSIFLYDELHLAAWLAAGEVKAHASSCFSALSFGWSRILYLCFIFFAVPVHPHRNVFLQGA
jgi:hypothetical protein